LGMKVGIGYDVHKLVEERALIIGGVELDYDKGLLGHSDADVLIHAIMDALIGAMGKGDIGVLFPDTSAKYKDISSVTLLKDVKSLLDQENYKIINIDAVIIAQNPKMSPYISKMKEVIAVALDTEKSQINIKATTEEGLGFTGNGEGISAKAVCLIEN